MIKKKIKVFYDGSCKICTKEINFYHKNDKNNKENSDKTDDHTNVQIELTEMNKTTNT